MGRREVERRTKRSHIFEGNEPLIVARNWRGGTGEQKPVSKDWCCGPKLLTGPGNGALACERSNCFSTVLLPSRLAIVRPFTYSQSFVLSLQTCPPPLFRLPVRDMEHDSTPSDHSTRNSLEILTPLLRLRSTKTTRSVNPALHRTAMTSTCHRKPLSLHRVSTSRARNGVASLLLSVPSWTTSILTMAAATIMPSTPRAPMLKS